MDAVDPICLALAEAVKVGVANVFFDLNVDNFLETRLDALCRTIRAPAASCHFVSPFRFPEIWAAVACEGRSLLPTNLLGWQFTL
ncbi:MAG: hypothetical protein ACLQJ0_01890 [Steroidobacteraceae bacterium]